MLIDSDPERRANYIASLIEHECDLHGALRDSRVVCGSCLRQALEETIRAERDSGHKLKLSRLWAAE